MKRAYVQCLTKRAKIVKRGQILTKKANEWRFLVVFKGKGYEKYLQ